MGSWTIDPDHASPLEKFAADHGFFGATTYNADGTGLTLIREGSRCGPVRRRHNFRWDIIHDVLVTTDGKKVLRDQILSLTRDRALLLSLNEPEIGRQYRVRTEECGTS